MAVASTFSEEPGIEEPGIGHRRALRDPQCVEPATADEVAGQQLDGQDCEGLSPSKAPMLEALPEDFLRFLKSNGVPLDAFRILLDTSRYVRVNPRGALASVGTPAASAQAVSEALGGARVERVSWLRRTEEEAVPETGAAGDDDGDFSPPWAKVYACDVSTNLSRTEAYRKGHLFGVDAASIFAVLCLGVRPGDRVLDLCCAPGAKLCAIADAACPGGEVVGVDIAEPRLAACRTMLNKYSVTNARLSLGDGTTWDPQAASWFDLEPPPRGRGQRARKRKRDVAVAAAAAVAAESGEVAEEEEEEEAERFRTFDRVLVDAECTHDASLRHIEKFGSQWGWETLGGRVPWVRQEEKLYELQVALLRNGFRLLKDGGSLIYSTCSLCRSQNEDIIAKFLKSEPRASLEALPLPLRPQLAGEQQHADAVVAGGAESSVSPARPGLLEVDRPLGAGGRYCMARFDPRVSGTSGLFIARLRRDAPTSTEPGDFAAGSGDGT
mmetsp:Transcript_87868/g.247932  ORF Transcript_87868/g.247932 Transcript_87868/m.247932 type:complete len:497 (-) Transcript_87868:39-1529(-)